MSLVQRIKLRCVDKSFIRFCVVYYYLKGFHSFRFQWLRDRRLSFVKTWRFWATTSLTIFKIKVIASFVDKRVVRHVLIFNYENFVRFGCHVFLGVKLFDRRLWDF